MRRLSIAVMVVVVVLAACSPATSQPSADASRPPATPSPVPTAGPSSSPSAPVPLPTAGAGETPVPVELTTAERYLQDGVQRGAIDCRPVRDALPGQALAGIECRSDDAHVARIGFYLFASDKDMLDVYLDRMHLEGVELDVGDCIDGEGEGAYIPEEGLSPDRRGCFVNAEGYANLRVTISGNHVYIGVLGRSANMRALDDFAWRGDADAPGTPTLWRDPDA